MWAWTQMDNKVIPIEYGNQQYQWYRNNTHQRSPTTITTGPPFPNYGRDRHTATSWPVTLLQDTRVAAEAVGSNVLGFLILAGAVYAIAVNVDI